MPFANHNAMQHDRSTKYSTLSLFSLLKLGFFETIYAKSNPDSQHGIPVMQCCPDSAAGGDAPAPPPRKCSCNVPDEKKCTAGDRGKTGAGVTGSRTLGGSRPICPKGEEELPSGASYPGLLRHIHNAARYRLPQCFEGASVSVKQNSVNNWVLGHSMSFSSVSPGGYKMLLSYVDKTKASKLPYFVMEAAPGGQMSCELRVGPTTGTRATVVTQVADGEFYSLESIIDAYFENCSASVIAVNRDFIALHYLQVSRLKIVNILSNTYE